MSKCTFQSWGSDSLLGSPTNSREQMYIGPPFSGYVGCIPNILVLFDYGAAHIPAPAIPDIFQSVMMAITFTHKQSKYSIPTEIRAQIKFDLLISALLLSD
ncbi:hypothetical protein BOTBODRAFT_182516 [Botryobasidium botryosum FD-172 SS1]|uniref:Uncharacterized protein n=1 Tax=Botryobasidium botryosum (strain FD-172 SS1) TaxID=930990 RepID=A0A067LQL1_BOTB1|nr:hypothetical protein BOTBODRAFT_182516 [Botryobasidium botryosum FD-172 SS1]